MTHEMLISLAPVLLSVRSCSSLQGKEHTLRYHFDVHIVLSERREHLPSNAYHILHICAYQTEDGHFTNDTNIAALLKLLFRLQQVLG